jgi:hypothetical protein
MIYTSSTSPWMQTLQPFLEKKKRIQTDAWGYHPSDEVDAVFKPLVDWVKKVAPQSEHMYPSTWDVERHVSRLVKQCLVSENLSLEFAQYFEGMGFEALEAMAKSFAFEECVQRDGLNKALREHAGLYE